MLEVVELSVQLHGSNSVITRQELGLDLPKSVIIEVSELNGLCKIGSCVENGIECLLEKKKNSLDSKLRRIGCLSLDLFSPRLKKKIALLKLPFSVHLNLLGHFFFILFCR